jgi:hypothetical protein
MRQHSGNFVICSSKKLLIQNCEAPEKNEDFSEIRKKPQESFVDYEDF